MIAVLDYDAGNLTSVALAVRHVGYKPLVTRDPEKVRAAERIIFPGVGAAKASMESLNSLGLAEALKDAYRAGKPILGICIGCQVIFSRSDEDGGAACLDLLPGDVVRFQFAPDIRRKIPHMGWNETQFRGDHPIFGGVPEGSQFYFVHSYYVRPADEEDVRGTAIYGGVEFATAVARDNLVAVQFHPEKSGPAGLRVLENFLCWTPE